jgi:hypothetical protein
MVPSDTAPQSVYVLRLQEPQIDVRWCVPSFLGMNFFRICLTRPIEP